MPPAPLDTLLRGARGALPLPLLRAETFGKSSVCYELLWRTVPYVTGSLWHG